MRHLLRGIRRCNSWEFGIIIVARGMNACFEVKEESLSSFSRLFPHGEFTSAITTYAPWKIYVRVLNSPRPDAPPVISSLFSAKCEGFCGWLKCTLVYFSFYQTHSQRKLQLINKPSQSTTNLAWSIFRPSNLGQNIYIRLKSSTINDGTRAGFQYNQ